MFEQFQKFPTYGYDMWKYQEDQRAHHKAEFFKKHPYNYQDWMKHWARMEPKIEEHFHKKEYAKFIQMNKRCLSREQLQVENQSDSETNQYEQKSAKSSSSDDIEDFKPIEANMSDIDSDVKSVAHVESKIPDKKNHEIK